ncbi:phosphoglycerate mutase-like protein, partial [Jaminaea rosea]
GIVVLTRHGDRQGFYQNPKTYSAIQTNLTVAGYVQEYNNGVDLRNLYLVNATDSIQGINATQSETTQLNVMADAGGEGGVIIESANALLQGLYPPYNDTITLADGSTVSWDRAQLIPIETIEPDQDVWMEGWTDCDAWSDYLQDWYDSADFKAKAAIANPFYQSISNILGNRPLKLENAWNIFDYLNVQSIHNATLAPQILPHLAQARYWADYHEAGAFGNGADPSDIANIAGQSILPPLLGGFDDIRNTTTGLKIQYLAASYKPFLGLFNMMKLPSPLSTSVVDYASTLIFEIRDDATVTMRFRNGSSGAFEAYPLFGSSSTSMPIADFESKMQPYSLDSLSKWCNKCSNSETRGCATLAQLNGTGGGERSYAPDTSTMGRHHVSPVVAGVIGSMVTLAIAAVLL